MTALEIRLLAYALLALILLGGAGYVGAHFTALHYERVMAADRAAQTQAILIEQQKTIAAQAAQQAATQAAEKQYEDLKASADATAQRLSDSVRQLAALHSFVLSSPPGSPAQPDATPAESTGPDRLAAAAGRVDKTCREDAARLTALQTWATSLTRSPP